MKKHMRHHESLSMIRVLCIVHYHCYYASTIMRMDKGQEADPADSYGGSTRPRDEAVTDAGMTIARMHARSRTRIGTRCITCFGPR